MTLRELVVESGASSAIAERPTVVEQRENIRERFNSGLDELDVLIGWDKLIAMIGTAAAGILAVRIVRVYLRAKRRKSKFAQNSVRRLAKYTDMRASGRIGVAAFNSLVNSETFLINMNGIRVDQEVRSDLLNLAKQVKGMATLAVDAIL